MTINDNQTSVVGKLFNGFGLFWGHLGASLAGWQCTVRIEKDCNFPNLNQNNLTQKLFRWV